MHIRVGKKNVNWYPAFHLSILHKTEISASKERQKHVIYSILCITYQLSVGHSINNFFNHWQRLIMSRSICITSKVSSEYSCSWFNLISRTWLSEMRLQASWNKPDDSHLVCTIFPSGHMDLWNLQHCPFNAWFEKSFQLWIPHNISF